MSKKRVLIISYRLSMWGHRIAFQVLAQKVNSIRTDVLHTAGSDVNRKYVTAISSFPELARDNSTIHIYLRGSRISDDFKVTQTVGDSLDMDCIRFTIFEAVKSYYPLAEECIEDDGTTITVYA